MNEKAYLLNKGFWQVADPKIWIASTVPLVLGVMMSVLYTGEFHFLWMILSFIGVYFIETGKNAINECVDYASGADRCVDKEHRTSFSGGKKTIKKRKYNAVTLVKLLNQIYNSERKYSAKSIANANTLKSYYM